MTTTTKAIAFSQDDVKDLLKIVEVSDRYIHTSLNVVQFNIFEKYCSGSRLGSTFESAYSWIESHWEDLDAEAREWLEDDSDSPAAGLYHLPMGYCRFAATDKWVVYETTRGTVLAVSSRGGHYVRIPFLRAGGYHHSILQNLQDGWTEDQIDRRINPHRYV
jgi:hypothetical protein